MKFNPQEIRAAMDSRLSFIQENRARRARIRQAVRDGGNTRRRRPMTAAVAVTALVAVVAAGVVLATSLNLLDFNGNRDARLAVGDTQAERIAQTPAAASLGADQAEAYISHTQYDGNGLTINYTIENNTWREPFTPTEGQLAAMTKIEDGMPAILDADFGGPLLQQFESAMENGTPYGVTIYTLIAENRTMTDRGIDLGKADRTGGEITDDTTRMFYAYDSLWFDDAYLNLEIPLWINIVHMYFDGADIYSMTELPEAAGTMTATAWRTDEQTVHFSGTGTHLGISVIAEADVSSSGAELVLTMNGDGFLPLDDASWQFIVSMNNVGDGVPAAAGDVWYDVLLQDGEGNTLPTIDCRLTDAHTITASFQGTGSLPESLTAKLMLCVENAAANATHPIPLSSPREITWKTIGEDDVYPPTWAPEDNDYMASVYPTPELAGGNLLIPPTVTPTLSDMASVYPTPEPADSDAAEENAVYVSSWEELNAAALAGAKNVIVTANITYGENDQTVVFHNAVTIQAEGMHYNIDGGGKQILCVQGPDENTPLRDETVIRNLVFMYGKDPEQGGSAYGGAVFVHGPLRAESCAFLNNQSDTGALCVLDGSAVLSDCWMTNNAGSGLYIRNGNAYLTNCRFSECHAHSGGGVYAENADIAIVDSRFLKCAAEQNGGGIYLSQGKLSLLRCTLEGNIAKEFGGAIASHTSTVLMGKGSVISGNWGNSGGGIYAINGTVVQSGAEILNNEAGDGGGVCLDKSGMEISGGTISGNTAMIGGGIYVWYSQLNMRGGSITQNMADESGGGIYLMESTVSGDATVISDNVPENIVDQ